MPEPHLGLFKRCGIAGDRLRVLRRALRSRVAPSVAPSPVSAWIT